MLGPHLASGRDADVYALDEHRVLRRYRDGGEVAPEAAVMAYVGRHGFPVPEVYEAAGPDLVMERVTGPTLLRHLWEGEATPAGTGELLADLHARLHALPARGSQPAARILHLDLHPDNIILSPRGPVLIDWRNADEGPADLDLAMTAMILAEVAVGSHIPVEFAPVARETLRVFLDRAGGDPLSQLDRVWQHRADNPTLSAQEKQRLGAAAEQVRAGAAARISGLDR